MSKDLGRPSGFLAIGEVVDVESDPSQSGRARVRWKTGSAVQNDIADGDLPWTSCVHGTSNPSLNQVGGPHTGLLKGSLVIGIPIDGSGQDYLIMGSLVKGGPGSIDEDAQFDSEVPQSVKVQSNGGEEQKRYGDVNGVVTRDSIVNYADGEGGGKAAKYSRLPDSIGSLGRAIT